MRQKAFASAVLVVVASAPVFAEARAVILGNSRSVLWQDPGNIRARDLFHGSGGKQRAPRGPFTFVKESRGGTNPKFVVRDEAGVEWKVKLGKESRSETAATRLIWAAGYFTDDNYVLPVLRVRGMPKLSRGQSLVLPDGSMQNARMERAPQGARSTGSWKWKKNPFTGTRELNGLRVVMALLNNWDLKDSNTTIYTINEPHSTREVYLVSDVGATFGRPSYYIPSGKSNAKQYARSKFVTKVSPETVSFRSPSAPSLASVFFLPHMIAGIYSSRLRSLGRDIPRDDARWVGEILSRLSPRQIRDAFEGAGYSPAEVETFSQVVSTRIAQLTEL